MDKAVLEKYTKTHSIRFGRRQRKHFIEALHQDLHAFGYEPIMIKGKKLLSHAHSYSYGNMKQMKTIIVTPYGTPGRKSWKKALYSPPDDTKTANKTMVATYVPIFLFSTLVFGGLHGLQPLIASAGLMSLMSCGLFLLTVMLMHWMMHDSHNAHNYSRNSATVAAAVEIAKGLNRDERRKAGFLFTSKNEIRFIGAEAATKNLANAGKNPTLICLDCIAKGSVVQVGLNSQNRKLASEIAKYHLKERSIDVTKPSREMHTQNAMAYFKKTVVIPCGELDDAGSLCVIGTGTGKDRDIELEVLDDNITMVREYLHNQKQKEEGAA